MLVSCCVARSIRSTNESEDVAATPIESLSSGDTKSVDEIIEENLDQM